jgi:peptidoglycan/LPS O-acetylase OafA/YrhL
MLELMAVAQRRIPFLFGIRGVLALYVLFFHLNYMLLAAHAAVPAWYHRWTDWIRFGDFRVAAFFVISGFLLTIPTTRTADWRLPAGVKAFLIRRAERLLIPYYAAFALSLALFVPWMILTGQPVHARMLLAAIVSHVLLIHNLHPATMLLVNDTLWNVALEFQCYLLFVFVLLPSVRRHGPWLQLILVTLFALAPHFLLHGFLDWVRPWFVALYAMGVAGCALANRSYPELQRTEGQVPWGTIWLATAIATPLAVAASGIDTAYGDGWLANLLLGASVTSFLVYVRLGSPGRPGGLAKAATTVLSFGPLCAIGRISYSIYLIHYPILRLLVALAAKTSLPFGAQVALAAGAFVPFTVACAYLFHLRVERPFQDRVSAPAPKGGRVAQLAPG